MRRLDEVPKWEMAVTQLLLAVAFMIIMAVFAADMRESMACRHEGGVPVRGFFQVDCVEARR